MSSSSNIIKDLNNEYNSIPVTYCKHCLSLNIRIIDDELDYCDSCGSTETDVTDIITWQELYRKKYNKDF